MEIAENIRILVVEDNRFLRQSVIELLEMEPNFQVVEKGASNGQEAVALCELFKPDIVLMDLMMPVIDGIKAIQIIHEFQPASQILVFSNGGKAMEVEALQAGAIDIVPKGDPSRMLNKIRDIYHDAHSIGTS